MVCVLCMSCFMVFFSRAVVVAVSSGLVFYQAKRDTRGPEVKVDVREDREVRVVSFLVSFQEDVLRLLFYYVVACFNYDSHAVVATVVQVSYSRLFFFFVVRWWSICCILRDETIHNFPVSVLRNRPMVDDYSNMEGVFNNIAHVVHPPPHSSV